MNERIKELAKQATEEVIRNTPSFLVTNDMWKEKFAELIVTEMYVFMCYATDNDKPWPTYKEVREHFGVEA